MGCEREDIWEEAGEEDHPEMRGNSVWVVAIRTERHDSSV